MLHREVAAASQQSEQERAERGGGTDRGPALRFCALKLSLSSLAASVPRLALTTPPLVPPQSLHLPACAPQAIAVRPMLRARLAASALVVAPSNMLTTW